MVTAKMFSVIICLSVVKDRYDIFKQRLLSRNRNYLIEGPAPLFFLLILVSFRLVPMLVFLFFQLQIVISIFFLSEKLNLATIKQINYKEKLQRW